jgi:hypothetical protein
MAVQTRSARTPYDACTLTPFLEKFQNRLRRILKIAGERRDEIGVFGHVIEARSERHMCPKISRQANGREATICFDQLADDLPALIGAPVVNKYDPDLESVRKH